MRAVPKNRIKTMPGPKPEITVTDVTEHLREIVDLQAEVGDIHAMAKKEGLLLDVGTTILKGRFDQEVSCYRVAAPAHARAQTEKGETT